MDQLDNFQNNNWQEEEEDSSTLNVTDLIQIFKKNWYWFLVSVLFCGGLGLIYAKMQPNVYSRTASVMVKDQMRGSQLISEGSVFEDLGSLNRSTNVENEMFVFKSKDLMKKVVRRLHLDMSYQIKNGLRYDELYLYSPVKVTFLDVPEDRGSALIVTTFNPQEALLTIPGLPDSLQQHSKMKIKLNDTVQTVMGRVLVQPTLYYTEKTYGVPIQVFKGNVDNVASGYSAGLGVSLASKMSSVVNLTCADVSPQRAEDVLSTLIDVYVEEAISDKNKIAVNTSNFINDRLIIIEKELGGVDSEIEKYKKEHQLTDIRSEAGLFVQTTGKYQQEKLNLDNQKNLALYIREYLMDATNQKELIPANTGVNNGNLEQQIAEYNAVMLKRDKLVAASSDHNPVVMNLNNSLSAMRQTIIRTVDNLIASLDIQINNTREQEFRTQRRIEAVPTQQKYVLSVERQQKIKEELYLYLLNKREENELTMSIAESNIRVIEQASGSNSPVAPRKQLILLAALFFGFCIPAGLLWLLCMIDTKVRSRKDVEEAITAPFLGEIPELPLSRKERKQLGSKINMIVKENSRDVISESFRIIRTNLEFMNPKDRQKSNVIMFTSMLVGAGKTFVSTNLAMTMAIAGKKVIMVDLDIRKGTMSKYLNAPEVGVSSYLSGQVEDIQRLICESGFHSNLDMIGKGPIPPNPAELLLSDRLDQLVNYLRECYDYVILDNVPSNMVADAAIVSRVADQTIYVIRAGKIEKRMLQEVEKLYRQQKFRNMAVLLNGVDYSGSYYGYGYGYKYDYGKD